MSTETKLRRGTATQCNAGTPVEAELWVDLTNDRLRLGDASLVGGHQIPNATDIQKGSFNTVTAGGTANAVTTTLDPVPASYFTNMTVIFKATATNTGATTLNVNGLGVKNIYKVSGGSLGPLAAGDLTNGAYYTVRYDGTQFVLEGSSGGVSSVSGTGGITVSPTSGAVSVSLNTNNALGVGSTAMLLYTSGTTLNHNGTTSSSNLALPYVKRVSGDIQVGTSAGTDGTLSGTWRNISGMALQNPGNSEYGLFIRTA